MEILANFLNPLSQNFFGYRIVSGIIDGFTTFFTGDEQEGTTGIFGFLQSIITGIGNLVSFITNFFTDLLDFFIHIFVPTNSQWEEIKQDYSDLGTLIQSKLPFVSFWNQSLDNARNQVFSNNDFLNITMPSFSFYGGQTTSTQYVNVRDSYEPYRVQIRSLLALIVYGCGVVYLVKTVLNYKATAIGLGESANISERNKK